MKANKTTQHHQRSHSRLTSLLTRKGCLRKFTHFRELAKTAFELTSTFFNKLVKPLQKVNYF